MFCGSFEGFCAARGAATTPPMWLVLRSEGPAKVPNLLITPANVGNVFALRAFRLDLRIGRDLLRFGYEFEVSL